MTIPGATFMGSATLWAVGALATTPAFSSCFGGISANGLIAQGAIALGGLGGNILAGFLYEILSRNRKSGGGVSELITSGIGEAIRATLREQGGEFDEPLLGRLGDAAGRHWERSGVFSGGGVDLSLGHARAQESLAEPSEEGWFTYLREISHDDEALSENLVRAAAKRLGERFAPKLRATLNEKAAKSPELLGVIQLEFLADILSTVNSTARKIDSLTAEQKAGMRAFQDEALPFTDQLGAHTDLILRRIDALAAASVVGDVSGKGPRRKEELARRCRESLLRIAKAVESLESRMARLDADGSRSGDTAQATQAVRAVQAAIAAHRSETRRTKPWIVVGAISAVIAAALAVAFAVGLPVHPKPEIPAQSARVEVIVRNTFEIHQDLSLQYGLQRRDFEELIYNRSKYSREEIRNAINEGAKSPDAQIRSMALIMQKNYRAAVEVAGLFLDQHLEASRERHQEIASLAMIKALGLLELDQPQPALAEFRRAFGAMEILGGEEHLVRARTVAAVAFLWRRSSIGLQIIHETLRYPFRARVDLSETEILHLLSSPGLATSYTQDRPSGWMLKEPLLSSFVILEAKDMRIIGYYGEEAGNTDKAHDEGSAVTAMVGYHTLTLDPNPRASCSVRESLKALDLVIHLLQSSNQGVWANLQMLAILCNALELHYGFGNVDKVVLYGQMLARGLADLKSGYATPVPRDETYREVAAITNSQAFAVVVDAINDTGLVFIDLSLPWTGLVLRHYGIYGGTRASVNFFQRRTYRDPVLMSLHDPPQSELPPISSPDTEPALPE